MDRVRRGHRSSPERLIGQLRRPAVWPVPMVVAAIQLVGSVGPRHRADVDLHLAPLNWLGYLLLLAGPVALLLRTVYPYAVLWVVLAITVAYQSAGFGFGPIFVSLIVAFLTAATIGPRWRTYPLPVLGWVVVVWLVPSRVMVLVAESLTNAEIGARLFVSPATARTSAGY